MSAPASTFRGFMVHLLNRTRWRAALVLLSMIAVALTEGLGLLLLVPLLSLIDVAGSSDPDGVLALFTSHAEKSGFDLNLGHVLTAFMVLIALRQALVYTSQRLVEETRIGYVSALRKELFTAIGRTRWRTLRGKALEGMGQILLIDGWRAGDAALNLFRCISSGVLILVNAAVAMMIAPSLALLVIVGLVLLMLVFGRRFRAARARGGRVSSVQDEIYTVVENYLDNLRLAKLSATESNLQDQFGQKIDALADEMSGYFRETIAVSAILQLVAAGAIVGFVMLAVNIFGVTGPALLVLIFIVARLVPHFTALNQAIHHLSYHLPAFTNALATIEYCDRHREPTVSGSVVESPRRVIALDRVTVIAGDESAKVLLRNVNIELRVGEFVALEGPSGAGKSTLADVLAGLTDPDTGEFRIDGKALQAIDRVRWRQRVSYVPQAAALLRSTIRENLSWLSRRAPSDDEIWRTLADMGLSERVASMPDA